MANFTITKDGRRVYFQGEIYVGVTAELNKLRCEQCDFRRLGHACIKVECNPMTPYGEEHLVFKKLIKNVKPHWKVETGTSLVYKKQGKEPVVRQWKRYYKRCFRVYWFVAVKFID